MEGQFSCYLILPLLPPSMKEAVGKFKPFFAIWQYFNFKQMVEGRDLPKTGWSSAPYAFARGLEALKPELWH